MHAANAGGVAGGIEGGDSGMEDMNARGTWREDIGVFRDVGVGVEALENETGDEEGQRWDVDVGRKFVHPAGIAWLCTERWIWMGNTRGKGKGDAFRHLASLLRFPPSHTRSTSRRSC